MKTNKLLLLVAFLMLATTASAQFTTSSKGASGTPKEIKKGWNSIYVQYNNMGASTSVTETAYSDFGQHLEEIFGKSANGLSIGYSHAFSLSSSVPVYLEPGFAVQYVKFHQEGTFDDSYFGNYYDFDCTTRMLSLRVPVNLIYRFDIPNTQFAIEPNAGISLRYNVWGKIKETTDQGSNHFDSESNIFNGDKFWADEDGIDAMKRFQFDWQIGVNLVYRNVFLAFTYAKDINSIWSRSGDVARDRMYIVPQDFHVRMHTISATLGYRF